MVNNFPGRLNLLCTMYNVQRTCNRKNLFLTDIALDDVSCRLWQRESPEVARRKSQSTAYKQMEYAVLWRAFPASNFRIHCICMYVYIGVRRPLACPTSPCMSLMGTVWVKSTSLSVFSKRSLTHPVNDKVFSCQLKRNFEWRRGWLQIMDATARLLDHSYAHTPYHLDYHPEDANL